MKSYTLKKFIKEFRSEDGLGHISMSNEKGETEWDIPFSEVICDICNAEITQPEKEPDKKVVFVVGTDTDNITETERGTKISDKVIPTIEKMKKEGKRYYVLQMCPACEVVTDVLIGKEHSEKYLNKKAKRWE